MSALVQSVATSMSAMGASGAATLVGMPWWLAALIALGTIGVAVLCAVVPQDSADRLVWWQSYWARTKADDPALARPEITETTPGGEAGQSSP